MSWVQVNVRNAKELVAKVAVQNGLATDGNSIFRISKTGAKTCLREYYSTYSTSWSKPQRSYIAHCSNLLPINGNPADLEIALNAIKAIAGVEARTDYPSSACPDKWALAAYALHCATRKST